MRYKDSVKEAIWIERTKNNLTYKEIADKLQITIYQVKKVITEYEVGRKQKRPGRRKSSKN